MNPGALNSGGWGKVLLATIALAVGLTMAISHYEAAAQQGAAPASPAEDKPGATAKKPPRGPLPTYYGKVVSVAQKERIYSIIDKYKAQTASLENQLAELRAKRDAEVEAVLDADQLAKVKQLRDEALAKKSTGKQPAAGSAPAAAPKSN